jgi:hypothetical protein
MIIETFKSVDNSLFFIDYPFNLLSMLILHRILLISFVNCLVYILFDFLNLLSLNLRVLIQFYKELSLIIPY